MNNYRFDYVNYDLVKKIFGNLSKLGLSFVLLTSGSNIAYAKDNYNSLSSTDSESYTIENIDDLMSSYNNAFDFQPVFISSNQLKKQVLEAIEKVDPATRTHGFITVGGLRKLESLSIDFIDGEDLSFLNYCSNLKKLKISGDVMGSGIIQLNKLKTLDIDVSYTDFEYLKFIVNSKNKIDLSIDTIQSFHADLLPYYKNINSLSLRVNHTTNVDFKKLFFLSHLKLYGLKYDLPIRFSKSDYLQLLESGVDVKIEDLYGNDCSEDFYEIDNKLNTIVANLSVSEDSSFDEKMDSILLYVLENCIYEPSLIGMDLDISDVRDFYKDGYLSGYFNSDTQICGNYSALTNALAYRLGIDSYMMGSKKHAWSLMELDGDYYFYDATILDNKKVTIEYNKEYKLSSDVIRDNIPSEKEKLTWYKINYDEFGIYRHKHDTDLEMHNPIDLPYFISIEQIDDDQNVILTLFSKGTKNSFILSKKQLFGMLSCTGLVQLAPSFRKKELHDYDEDESVLLFKNR